MEKEIIKGSQINPELSQWIVIVETAKFPKELFNFAVEYCDYHSRLESAAIATLSSIETPSLLGISLSILSKLDYSKIKKIKISDGLPTYEWGVPIEQSQMETLIKEESPSTTLLNLVEDSIVSNIVEKIDKLIEESNQKTLEVGIIVHKIQIIAEGGCIPIVTIYSNFKVY